MSKPVSRRRALRGLAAVSLGGAALPVLLAACGDDDSSSTSTSTVSDSRSDSTALSTDSSSTNSTSTNSTSTNSSTDVASAPDCSTIPAETAGPFPGDGSNGPNVLAEDGVVRADITSSIGSASGTADGLPLKLRFTIVSASDGCSVMAGAAVYAWHCDADGNYSMYGDITDENYLRGVLETGTDGVAEFTSIFPGCYPGRWPHVHFEVHASVETATGGGSPLVTSQLAFPQDECAAAYDTDGYAASASSLSQVSLESDGIFSDGVEQQLATMSGDASSGYTAALTVAV